MDILFTIFAFLILVGIVVSVHEGGHFFTALACGMKVTEFSIGFGPKIFQRKFGKDQILFTLRAFPLGGFVKPLDKSTVSAEEWEKVSDEDKKRTFLESPRWKKALMVFGGPFSNFVLAFFLLVIAATMIGNKGLPPVVGEVLPDSAIAKSGIIQGDVITKINDRQINFISDAHSIIANAAINGDVIDIYTERNIKHHVDFSQLDLTTLSDDLGKLTGIYFQGVLGDIIIKEVIEGGVAQKFGLKAGDIIVSIDGVKLQDISKSLRIIRNNPGKIVDIEYIRQGEKFTKSITLSDNYSAGSRIGKIDIKVTSSNDDNYLTVKLGFFEGISDSFEKVVSSTWTTLVSIKMLITGELSTKAISGPLSIADYSGKSAQKGLYTYLFMMASISIAVGVFNLMPIPMLDGGHLLQYGIETVRGKDFTLPQLQKIQYVGYLFMIGIFTFAMVNDINKYFS